MNEKLIEVAFSNISLKEAYLELEKGKFEEKELHNFIGRAIKDLKQNPTSGIKIPKQLWPKEYIIKADIDNLWKYNLPNAWRLIYTIAQNNIKIISIILDWMNHKDYERKFHY